MFVCNFKLNGNIIFKSILIFIIIVALIILVISSINLFKNTKFKVDDSIETSDTINIENNNYTNILENVYNNLEDYVGKNINYTGYVYRLKDMNENEFVLARDMLINSDSQSVVVGFLCNTKNGKEFKNGTWVNVSGSIIKGYYHNQIPVIEINKIEKTKAPEDAFVYPPDKTYIPTSLIF